MNKGFLYSLSDFHQRKPYSEPFLCQWIENICDKFLVDYCESSLLKLKSVSKRKYLSYLDALLKICFHIPNPNTLDAGGLFYGDGRKKLDEFEIKMLKLLLNSFGFYQEKWRKFQDFQNIESWIGKETYFEVENWIKIIRASEKFQEKEIQVESITSKYKINQDVLN